MNKSLLKAYMAKYHDTQLTLSQALGISLSCLNAKINGARGADFRQTEMAFIKERYSLSASEVTDIFFDKMVS